jgi:hypothetical protein
MKLLKKIYLNISLYTTKYQFRVAKSVWYNCRIYEPGTISEKASYNTVCKYESRVRELERIQQEKRRTI